MIVTQLKLQNFRNYESCDLRPDPGLNVLFGNNGQGKTNIIEAIYMCSCARSHRTPKDSDLIRHGQNFYSIDLSYQSNFNEIATDAYEEELGITYKTLQTIDNYTKRYERILSRDQIRLDRTSDFIGLFHAVMFAPEDLQLIKEGPSVRRRFLDLLISQISPVYFRNLQIFARLLRQRNTLLKQFRDNELYKEDNVVQQLAIWDEQYSQCAAQIIAERLTVIDRIAFTAAEIHSRISGGKENLTFKYRTQSGIDISKSTDEIAEVIYQRLSRTRADDIFRGNTSCGPHRDDFDIYLNDLPLKHFGSQGQQRTAVLAMKMAELEFIRHKTHEAPVLLLDDVMSELDINRRELLLSSLQHVQIFVTCTDPEQLDRSCFSEQQRTEARYFEVQEGSLRQVI